MDGVQPIIQDLKDIVPEKILRRKNGTGRITKGGIVLYKPDHENSSKNGSVFEHIYVMSQHVDRLIKDDEKVIHINGNNKDNNISNLRIISDRCVVECCDNRGTSRMNLCRKHNRRYLKYGDPNIIKQAPNGSGTIDTGGYRRLFKPGHPNSDKSGRIAEHRYVMSKYIGRPLYNDETVHHKNGNRLDNKLENLELWASSHPSGQCIEDLIAWAREILERYED